MSGGTISDAPSLRESSEAEAVTAALVYAIANDLERSIAALGYPVGCGAAPHPDVCHRAATSIVAKISDRALEVLATRKDGSSQTDKDPSQ